MAGGGGAAACGGCCGRRRNSKYIIICVPIKVMMIRSRNLYIYPENPVILQNKNRSSWSGED